MNFNKRFPRWFAPSVVAAALFFPSVQGSAKVTPSSAPDEAFAHHLTGVILAVRGPKLTLRLRDGRYIAVDIAQALRDGTQGVLPVNHPVIVYGIRGSDGIFHVSNIGHASSSPRYWQSDAP